MEDFRLQVRELVIYMLDLKGIDDDDDDVIDNYTDTIMLVCEDYHDMKTNKEKNVRKNRTD